ncbi:MAG: hypothetical protein EOO39_06690 [Cytophagaceae bacterium]|nr:MAG: hypothetical protein EOO39_06690 [Cytophagaceae bacterium]
MGKFLKINFGGQNTNRGFLLPGVIILSLAVSVIATSTLSVITNTSNTLNNSYYKTQANTAAQAGITLATNCIQIDKAVSWSASSPLRPASGCSGSLLADVIDRVNYVASGSQGVDWTSEFEVKDVGAPVNGQYLVESTGIVTFKRKDGSTIENATIKTSNKAVIGLGDTRPVGTIKSIETGANHTCAITLSDLPYCWGNSEVGSIGDGDGSLVTKAINPSPRAVAQTTETVGRTYSALSTGGVHTCGIVNAKILCWGGNGNGQLGVGSAFYALTTTTFAYAPAPNPVDMTAIGSRIPTKVAGGGDVTCAIASSKAYCWGQNAYRQSGSPNNFCWPSAFGFCSGTIQAVTPMKAVEGAIANLSVVDISTNLNHSCGVDTNGYAYCWGNNTYGQIGNNSTTQASTSVAVTRTGALTGKPISKISNGTTHTCAIAGTNEELFCWGSNEYGELGVNNLATTQSNVPVNVSAVPGGILNGKKVTSVSAGNTTTCAVADSKAYCWGRNDAGQLGLGFTSSYADPQNPVKSELVGAMTPTPITSPQLAGKTITQISIKNNHGCAVADSVGYCWGLNSSGQLGNNKITSTNVPVAVRSTDMNVNGRTASDIAIGLGHACAISSGKPLCWGQNSWGQLGNGQSIISFETTPTSTAGTALNGKVVTNITTSGYGLLFGGDNAHSCALADGDAYCWGTSTQVGSGGVSAGVDGYLVPIPVKKDGVLAGKKLTSINAGYLHTCAVGNDKRAYCWGNSSSCQLGNNSPCTNVNVNQPVAVATTVGALLTKDVTQVGAGYAHSCALADGSVFCWGDNAARQLGDGTTSARAAPVAVNASLLGSSVTNLSVGYQANCAVSNGNAYCWGLNNYGQLGQPTTLANSSAPILIQGPLTGKTVTQVAMGAQHACALVSEGDLYCWGLNETGQLGNGSLVNTTTPTLVQKTGPLTGKAFTQVSTNLRTTCALADSKPYCWGSNSSGQLGDASTTNKARPNLVFSFDGVATAPPVSEIPSTPGIVRY